LRNYLELVADLQLLGAATSAKHLHIAVGMLEESESSEYGGLRA
jgi:hypothetical protein